MVKLAAVLDRLAVLAGAGLVVCGVSSFSTPAALVTAGLFLLAGALWRIRS